MGKDVKKKFTVSLDIEMKDAEKQVKATVGNLKTILADLGNASDKMGYFKDLVDYIGQIDTALTALRNKNKDAFDHMFDGLDKNLRKQLEDLFGTDGATLSQLNVLHEKLATLTPKSGIKELRNFAQEINDLFTSIGQNEKLDIEQFKNVKANASHIQLLTDALNDFTTVWDGVNNKIKSGFGFGGSGGGHGGAISGLSKEVQEEIDKLKKQQKEIQEIFDSINSPEKVNVKLAKKYIEQVEQLKTLKQAFLDAASAKTQLENANMTGSNEYLHAVANYVKTAAELKSAFESESLSNQGIDWVVDNGTSALQDADNVLDGFLKKNEAMMNKVQNMYSEKIVSISNQIEFLAKPYDILKEKIQEYATLQDTINNNDRLTDDEEDEIYAKVDALEKYFVSLDKVGNKKQEIKNVLGDLTFGDISGDDALEEFCNLLSVDIPNAAQKAKDALKPLDTSGTVSDSTSGDKKSDASTIVEDVKDTVDALDYAKKELAKAWQEYYKAAREATSQGINLITQEPTDKMDAIERSISKMLDKWNLEPSQKKTLMSMAESIQYDAVDFDDIGQNISGKFNLLEQIKHPINVEFDTVSTSVNELQNDLSKIGSETKESSQEASTALGRVENEVQDVNTAFQNLVNYISQSGSSPSKFFDKLESGAQSVDDELNDILQSLKLIDSSGNINLESIKSGYTNKGGFVSDQYTMIARPDWYLPKIESLQPMLAEAKQAGAQIGAIFDIIEDKANGLIYEVQNTVAGTAAFSHHNNSVNQDALNATEDQIKGLISTLQTLQQKGLFIDWGGDNVLYDKDQGFSVIDLGNKGGKPHTVSVQNTMQENLDRFVSEMFKFDKGVKQSPFVDNLYKFANDMGNQVYNPNIATSKNQHKSIQDATDAVTSSVKAEEDAHEQNTAAINAENVALQAQIELKKKAQSMKWEAFALDESSADLKKQAGFQTLSDMEKFWKAANYEKQIDWHEISKSEAEDIFNTKLPKGLANEWYGPQKFNVKDKLENEILADDEIRNAALNYLYHIYKQNMPFDQKDPNVKTFEDFLNTEFTVYRGDDAPLIYGDESKLSFSFKKSSAEGFNGDVGTAKIIPKETIGNAGSFYENEIETFVDSYKTSWFKQAGDAFEDFYNKQTKEMQNEIDIGLINLEKQRISDILGDDFTKLTHQAGKTSDFQNSILKQFQQGIVQDNIVTSGLGDINDEFADAYNGLSNVGKKLAAYYASMDAISSTMPKQFTITGWKESSKDMVGKDANLFNAVLNDPTGVKKHVANLTGELGFNLFNKSDEEIKAETEAIKQHTKAVQDNAQAQQATADDSKSSYDDVQEKLLNKMNNPSTSMEKFNDLAPIYHELIDVAYTSDSDVIQDGLYQKYLTGEVVPVSDLINMINKVEQKYGENLDYVKNYLNQIYGKLDYDSVEKQLYDATESAESIGKYKDLSNLYNDLESVHNTELNHPEQLSKNLYMKDDGEVLYVSEIYNAIDKIEQKYGENLKYVKDYLQQVYGKLDADSVSSDIDDVTIPDGDDFNLNDALKIVTGYDDVHAKLEKAVMDAKGTSKAGWLDTIKDTLEYVQTDVEYDPELIASGKYFDADTQEKTDWSTLSELVSNYEAKYHDNLDYVHDYLKQVFSNASDKIDNIFVELEDDDFDIDLNKESTNAFNDIFFKLESLNDGNQEKFEAIAKLQSKISDISYDAQNNVDLIDQGKYMDSSTWEATDWAEVSDLVSEFETQYGENLDYIHDYLKQVFAKQNEELDQFLSGDSDFSFNDISSSGKEYSVKDYEDAYGLQDSSVQEAINDLARLQHEYEELQSKIDSDPIVISNLETQLEAKEQEVYNSVSQDFRDMIDNDSSDSLEQYFSQLAKQLQVQKEITDEKQKQENIESQVDEVAPEQKLNVEREITEEKKRQSVLTDEIAGNQKEQLKVDVDKVDSTAPSGSDYALEPTLQQTNGILNNILSEVSNDESSNQIAEPLNNAVAELNKVANGIVEHQKAQKTDTSVAMAKIADPTQYKQISNIAMGSVGQLGSEVQINILKALADGVVKVEGAFKNADGAWEGFTVKVNESNQAVDLAINKQSAYAKALNNTSKNLKKQGKADYGSNIMSTQMGKHNSLQSKINGDSNLLKSDIFASAIKEYEDSFSRLSTLYNNLKGVNPTEGDKADFKEASAECNNLAKEVEKLIKTYEKMHSDPNLIGELELGDDFNNNYANSRKQALLDYVESMHGAKAKIGDFKNNYRELLYTIDNGDGTFTEAKASIDNLGTSIVATAGDAMKATSKFGSFFDSFVAKSRELWVYAASRFGVDEIIQQVRQGIGYVKEIDTALTELKKVTSETDATYDRFLQSMSKTAGVVGSTVSELTTMAADWARLGYSIEEAGKLAESTAILLNVSEFQDANAASEALISTMQAFQYTADESQHVVDVLNEVGFKMPNNIVICYKKVAITVKSQRWFRPCKDLTF